MMGKALLIKQRIGWLSSDFKDRNSKGKKEAGLKHGLK